MYFYANEGEPVFVFDIDGVLVDVEAKLREVFRQLGLERLKASPDLLDHNLRRKFWKLFLSKEFMVFDRPRRIGIELLLSRLEMGRVVVITGRPQHLRGATIRELKAFGIPVERVFFLFRPKGDYRKDYVLKADFLSRLSNVIEVHDDSIEVLMEARKIHPHAKLYLHKGNGYELVD